jgi:dihydroxy-acid dehydratase
MAAALAKAKGNADFPGPGVDRGNRFEMDAKTHIKARLPSRHVTEGPERAPHPAIAHECGSKFDLFDVAEIFKKTPCVADLKPAGRDVAKDIFEVGGIPLLMKTLLDNGHSHGDCITVTGRTIAENLKSVKWNPHQDVVRSADRPITVTGGVVGLKGNLAPEGAIVKVAGMSSLKFTGPARCFDREEDALESVQNSTTAALTGPIALVRDDDITEIDADVGTLNVKLTDAELAERETKWQPRATNHTSGALWKYAQQVGPAVDGAVTHPGGAYEKQCYADI